MNAHDMIEAVKAGDAGRVRAVLRAKQALVNAKDEHGTSAVLTAVYWGKGDVLKVLLRHKPQLNVFEAAAAGQLAQVKAQIKAKPKLLNSYSHDGFTPLHLAAFFGRASVAHFLLKHKPEVNAHAHGQGGVTPLGSAAAGSHTGICRMLIEHGADVHAAQDGGYTALHSAAQNGNGELVDLLLGAGAERGAKTNDGKTAHDLALAAGHTALAERLIPPVGRLNRVMLFVADVPRVRAFYEQTFGLRAVGHADDGWVSLASDGGFFLSLHRNTGRKHSGGSAAQLVFHVEDVAAARETLIARGVVMDKVIDAGHGLQFCDGRDPEGNWFQISSR